MFRKFRPKQPVNTSFKFEKQPGLFRVCNSEECFQVIQELILHYVNSINHDKESKFIVEKKYDANAMKFSMLFSEKSKPAQKIATQISYQKFYVLHLSLGEVSGKSLELNSKNVVLLDEKPVATSESEVSKPDIDKDLNLQTLFKAHLNNLIQQFKVLNHEYTNQRKFEEELRNTDSGFSANVKFK